MQHHNWVSRYSYLDRTDFSEVLAWTSSNSRGILDKLPIIPEKKHGKGLKFSPKVQTKFTSLKKKLLDLLDLQLTLSNLIFEGYKIFIELERVSD